MLDVDALMIAVRGKVVDLEASFRDAPGLILTEDDLKCELARRLHKIYEIQGSPESADPTTRAGFIHAEIPWFDNDGNLALRPDITVTDPCSLSLTHALQGGLRLPRKGFHFTGDSLLIELKFYRAKGGVRPASFPAITDDMRKLRSLIDRAHRTDPNVAICGLVVVFSRYATPPAVVTRLRARARHLDPVQLIYGSADMVHPGRTGTTPANTSRRLVGRRVPATRTRRRWPAHQNASGEE